MSRGRAVAATAVILLALQGSVYAEQYHYSMAARIRPLLLFWIGRSGVGDATITRQRTPERTRYSLLIGSDPDRAPRRINRWGYIEEDIQGPDAQLIGLMTQSDEESLEQADANLRTQAAGRHPFKVIRGTVNGDRASSLVTTIAAPEDYTVRQVGAALDLARRDSLTGTSRVLRLPPGTRPGFLAALADAMRTMSTAPIAYVYHGRLYELRQTRVQTIANFQTSGVAYGAAAAGDFLVTSRYDREQTRFSMTYGTSGSFADVPLKVTYQPRWWMQVELTIDATEPAPALAGGAGR
jgi:hypothetical protein